MSHKRKIKVNKMKIKQHLAIIGLGLSVGFVHSQTAKSDQAEKVTWPAVLCAGQPAICTAMPGQGFLFAKSGQNKVVMISHGSQGIDSRMYDYVDALQKDGFAALVIDHFTPRGVVTTHDDYQGTDRKGANMRNMALDSLTAAAWLRDIKGFAKVGSIGESQGGQASQSIQRTTVMAIVNRNMSRLYGKPFDVKPVDAVVGLYGYCGYRHYKDDFYVNTPYLMIAGADDDSTPSRYCEEYIPWMNQRGAEGNAKVVVLPGEGHSFDAPYRRNYSFFPHYANCNILVDERGATELNSGITSATFREAQIKCETKGGSHSGYTKGRFNAFPIWLDFFKKNL